MTTLRKVLIVDDDPVVTKSFDRVLSTKGYAVVTARNGEEALRKIAAEEYDVVYTDIRMPGMDGIEVAEQIKNRRPWLPVVIVTGYGTAENEERAKAAGVSAVLHKPLSPAMIEGSAREALAQPQVHQPAALLESPPVAAKQATDGRSAAKTLALGLAAPFVGLAFALAFPFIGLGVLAKYAAEAAYKQRARIFGFVKNVTLFVAAPFIGLLYAAMFPLIGLGMLVWAALKARGVRAEDIKAGLKTVGMVIAAPLMGLVYAIALPFVLLGVLCWIGGKHLFTAR
jgi:CheY-like chemotaxis protein